MSIDISGRVSQILTAVFGKDVRSSIAGGLQDIAADVNKFESDMSADNDDFKEDIGTRQTNLENQYTQQVQNAISQNPSSAEVVAARTSTTGKVFNTIGARMDDHDSQLAENANAILLNPISSAFNNKITGSIVENPNIAKWAESNSLISPNGSWSEVGTGGTSYQMITNLDGNYMEIGNTTNGVISQCLFCFNIVQILENKYGTIPGNSTFDKVTWCKNNLKKIDCNWLGYGSCPVGYLAWVTVWNGTSYWIETDSTRKNTSSSITGITVRQEWNNSSDCTVIQNDGFVYILVYTRASDGITPSKLYTEYINIEIIFKDIFQRVLQNSRDINDKKIVSGTYVGDGTVSKSISIGFDAKLIYVISTLGGTGYILTDVGSWSGNSNFSTSNKIITNGFTVSNSLQNNNVGTTYEYIAIG